MSQTKTLNEAVLDVIVKNFAVPTKDFSAYEVTRILRGEINAGQYTVNEFAGLPTAHVQEVPHSMVRDAIATLAANGDLSVKNGPVFRLFSLVTSPQTVYVMSEVGKRCMKVVDEFYKNQGGTADVKVEDHLMDDLGFDDLDVVEIEMVLEDEFRNELKNKDVELDAVKNLTVRDVIEHVKKIIVEAQTAPTSTPQVAVPPVVKPVNTLQDKAVAYMKRQAAAKKQPTLKNVQSALKSGKSVTEVRDLLESVGYTVKPDSWTPFNQWIVTKK